MTATKKTATQIKIEHAELPKKSEVTKAIAKMNRYWLSGDCENDDLCAAIRELASAKNVFFTKRDTRARTLLLKLGEISEAMPEIKKLAIAGLAHLEQNAPAGEMSETEFATIYFTTIGFWLQEGPLKS